MLRIIGGKHRGRRIEMKEKSNIRPTSSMAREAIFNILTHGTFGPNGESPLMDQSVIDLFCGTGALGLEALSRGANNVTFVDGSAESLALTRQNVTKMGEEENAKFIRSDSTVLPPARGECALAFIDPPYMGGLAPKALKSLAKQGWLMIGGVAVVELSKRETLEPPEMYELFDVRIYGNTQIVFLRRLV